MRRFIMQLSVFMFIAGIAFQPASSHAQTDRQCFDAAGIANCVEGRFREYWVQNGGLAVFGYPLTPARYERSRDTGAIYLTQWFERNSLELHPENARPYDVLMGRLADARLVQLNRWWRDGPQTTAPQAGCIWFGQTSHNVCDQAPGNGFKSYIERHGLQFDGNPTVSAEESLALIGYPLTEVNLETNASGYQVLTQWFERARLEWYPNNADPYKVQLGLLGNEIRTNVPALKNDCPQPIASELRRQYEERRNTNDVSYRQLLGCPNFVMRDVNGTQLTGAVQTFQRGIMIWNSPTTFKGSPPPEITVIFLENPYRFITYADRWTAAEAEGGTESAPAGLFAPRRGFGKVWREEAGLRDGLGWATRPEQADRPVIQVFDYGWMIWMLDSDTVYTFFRDANEAAISPRLR